MSSRKRSAESIDLVDNNEFTLKRLFQEAKEKNISFVATPDVDTSHVFQMDEKLMSDCVLSNQELDQLFNIVRNAPVVESPIVSDEPHPLGVLDKSETDVLVKKAAAFDAMVKIAQGYRVDQQRIDLLRKEVSERAVEHEKIVVAFEEQKKGFEEANILYVNKNVWEVLKLTNVLHQIRYEEFEKAYEECITEAVATRDPESLRTAADLAQQLKGANDQRECLRAELVALEEDANSMKDAERELNEAISTQEKRWSMIQSLVLTK